MLDQLREWLKRHSWWAGGVGAVALVLLGGLSGAWFNSLFGGDNIEDELNKRNLVAGEELEALRTQVTVAEQEVDTLNAQLAALETDVAQDRAISEREFIRDALLSLPPTVANDPGLQEIGDLQRECTDELNAGNPVMALDCYKEVTTRLQAFCGVPEQPGNLGTQISEASSTCGTAAAVAALPSTGGPPPR